MMPLTARRLYLSVIPDKGRRPAIRKDSKQN